MFVGVLVVSKSVIPEDKSQLTGCLICGCELKLSELELAKHYSGAHELNILELGLNVGDLELVQTLQLAKEVVFD